MEEQNCLLIFIVYYSKPQRNLMSFKSICQNDYHVETVNEGKVEYLFITIVKAVEICVRKNYSYYFLCCTTQVLV